VENDHLATSVKHSRAEELIQYTVAKVLAEARSSRPDGTTHGVRRPGFGWHRPGSSGRGPHLRIPERKQVNCYQAFIIASSLWPFRAGTRVDLTGCWQQTGHMKDAVCQHVV